MLKWGPGEPVNIVYFVVLGSNRAKCVHFFAPVKHVPQKGPFAAQTVFPCHSMSDSTVLLSHPSAGTVARASSVLNRDIKRYGPRNALNIDDGSSCWNSDGSSSSSSSSISFTLNFGRAVEVTELKIQFQGGFVAEECSLMSSSFLGGGGVDIVVRCTHSANLGWYRRSSWAGGHQRTSAVRPHGSSFTQSYVRNVEAKPRGKHRLLRSGDYIQAGGLGPRMRGKLNHLGGSFEKWQIIFLNWRHCVCSHAYQVRSYSIRTKRCTND